MITGTHRYPRQERVTYGVPAVEAVTAVMRSMEVRRALLVTTRSLAGGEDAKALRALCAGTFSGVAAHSPREGVIAGAQMAREAKADLIVALGGGSAIDAAKVMQLCLWSGVRDVAGLDAYRTGDPSRAAAGLAPGVRMLAVPTTLSAAEFTPFAGVTDTRTATKEGFHHKDLAPVAVVLDPAVTVATPERLWLSTGIKAVDHAVEQLCNLERAPFGDALAEEGLKRLARSLPVSKDNPRDLAARADCQFGMWLAISGAGSGRGMGASHAIGHILGGTYGVPHGITSCLTLPAVLAWNAGADGGRQAVIEARLGGGPAAEAVRGLIAGLGLPTRLSEVGIGPDAFGDIAARTMHDRGVRTNPRPIAGPADIEAILALAA